MSLFWLGVVFALTAFAYAAVGFGGGSTYAALLALGELDYRLIPIVALACNLIVVSGGLWHYSRAGQLRIMYVVPFVCSSVPLAMFGGSLALSERLFFSLLGGALLLSAVAMLLQPTPATPRAFSHVQRWLIGLPVGAGIGLLAGIVGIGGGIFLAPLLHLTGWAKPSQIAALTSAFILLNSLAGLIGRATKWTSGFPLDAVQSMLALLLAVLVGGQLGSYLSARKLDQRWLRRLTAILILYVAARLLWRVLG